MRHEFLFSQICSNQDNVLILLSLNKRRSVKHKESLYFDVNKRCYVLVFKNNTISLRLCEFVALHKKLMSLDMVSLLNDFSDDADNHLFIFEKNVISLHLNLIEVTRLHAIFCEAMYMMRLQDLLYTLSIQLPYAVEELELVNS